MLHRLPQHISQRHYRVCYGVLYHLQASSCCVKLLHQNSKHSLGIAKEQRTPMYCIRSTPPSTGKTAQLSCTACTQVNHCIDALHYKATKHACTAQLQQMVLRHQGMASNCGSTPSGNEATVQLSSLQHQQTFSTSNIHSGSRCSGIWGWSR